MKIKLMVGIGMLASAVLFCYSDMASAFVWDHDNSLRWNDTQSVWDDANSWDNVQGPDLGYPGSAANDSNLAYAMIDGGTATITPADAPAGRVFRSYIGGTEGGTLEVSANSRYGRFYTAWLDGETGTLSLTDGTMTMESANVHLGHAGDSIATISGGTMDAIELRLASESTASSDFELSGGALNVSGNLILAYHAGSTSDLKVSGGALNAARLWLRSGTATVDVSGSGSTITVDRMLVGTTGHSMKVGLDAGGVTTINAVGSQAGGDAYEGASLNDLAIEVYDLPGFSGGAGSTYDIVSSTTSLDESGLTVTDTIPGLDFTWAIVPDGGNQVLRLTALAAPIAGDFDGNGIVDGADFLDWQRDPSQGPLSDWENNYGFGGLSAVGAVTAVPEPDAVSLFGLAIVIGSLLPNRKK